MVPMYIYSFVSQQQLPVQLVVFMKKASVITIWKICTCSEYITSCYLVLQQLVNTLAASDVTISDSVHGKTNICSIMLHLCPDKTSKNIINTSTCSKKPSTSC